MRHITILATLAIILLTGCKPTENNYKAAYDIARNKKSEASKENVLPGIKLQKDDEPVIRIINGDSIPVLTLSAKTVAGNETNKWLVITGRYKMRTNAMSHYEQFKDSTASLVESQDNIYYVAAKTAPSLQDAVKQYHKVRDSKRFPTVGITSAFILQDTSR